MSHYTVLVAARHPEDLERLLAPYDENTEVTPYREYEQGGPETFWAYEDLLSEGLIAVNQYVTWPEIVKAYNGKYYPDAAETDKDRLYLDEDGRAYTLSTYNPDSKWDWYSIGGRWTGYFRVVKEHADKVLRGSPGLMTEPSDYDHADGGPKYALDLKRMRKEAGKDARERYARYGKLVKGTPKAMPWRSFADNISEGNGYTADQARMEYAAQARVQRLRESEFDTLFGPDAIEEFSVSPYEYVTRAENAAVPGYALVTPDGEWVAPGKMGWFGMSSDEGEDRTRHQEKVNAYIDSLPDDMYLIMVDCHI